MRILLVTSLLMIFSIRVFSQNPAPNANYDLKERDKKLAPDLRKEMNVDTFTLGPSSLDIPGCGNSVALFTVTGPGGGFVCGTNGKGDRGVAQRYDLWGTGSLYSVIVFFGGKMVQGNSTITATAYSSSAAGPDVLLGTSQPVSITAVDTVGPPGANHNNIFHFTNPVPLVGDFYVGIDVTNCYTQSDSVGAYSTIQGCFSNVQRAWEQLKDSTWVPFNDGTNGTWGLNVDILIFPMLDIVPYGVGISDNHISNRGLELYGNFPNPATDFTMIKYSLDENSAVKIDILNESGQFVKSVSLGDKPSGSHYYLLDVNDLAPGNYFYSVNTEQSTLFSRLLVGR